MAGGSSGIGLATAQLLAADGAAVTITGRHEERLAAAHAALAARGHIVWALPCDSMVSADLAHAVSIAGSGGRLDIAVSVPGGPGLARSVTDSDDAEFMAVVDRNVRPVVLMIKHASQAMDGDGSIVVVSSTAAAGSARGLAAYAAAKAAVDAVVRVAADELGARGVRVNSVRPGGVPTSSGPVGGDRELVRAPGADQPLARSGQAGDIAQAIRYLAGPESSWVTGQCLAVDGGRSLRAHPDATPGRRGLH